MSSPKKRRRFYRTASGKCITDGGAWQFLKAMMKMACAELWIEDSQMYTFFVQCGRNCMCRHQDFDVGFLCTPKLARKWGYTSNDWWVGTDSEQRGEVNRKTLITDLALVGGPRLNVEMGNFEDGEPLEAGVTRERMNPKNPTSREKQEHEEWGHDVCRNCCAACVEVRGVGGQHRFELLEEEERERTSPIVAFDRHNSDLSRVGLVKLERHVVNGHVQQHIPFHFLSFSSKILVLRRIILKCDNEPSTKSLQDAVIQVCAGVEVTPQGQLWEWSHGQRSCGDGGERSETTMQNASDVSWKTQACASQMTVRHSAGYHVLQLKLKRQCRTLGISAHQCTSVRIIDDGPRLSWLLRFAAQVMKQNENM